MSRRYFDLVLTDKGLLAGSALLLLLIGVALSRDAEQARATARPAAAAVSSTRLHAPRPLALQRVSRANLAPAWNAPPRQSSWVF